MHLALLNDDMTMIWAIWRTIATIVDVDARSIVSLKEDEFRLVPTEDEASEYEYAKLSRQNATVFLFQQLEGAVSISTFLGEDF